MKFFKIFFLFVFVFLIACSSHTKNKQKVKKEIPTFTYKTEANKLTCRALKTQDSVYLHLVLTEGCFETSSKYKVHVMVVFLDRYAKVAGKSTGIWALEVLGRKYKLIPYQMNKTTLNGEPATMATFRVVKRAFYY